MQYIVCYDISDDRRRDHVARALLDFGQRVEESVFVANLDDELAARMRERVARLIEPETDRLHVFRLCKECAGKTEVYGEAFVPQDRDFYVI
jgi:CRISPR-associated protein Cas2